MNMVQVGILGVMGALFAIQFQSDKKEYGIYMSVAISLFIFFSIIGKLEIITETVRAISSYIRVDTMYFGTLLKILGVTYVAEIASAICKDTGHQTLSTQIEIFGKLTILVLALPVLLALLQTIGEFLT